MFTFYCNLNTCEVFSAFGPQTLSLRTVCSDNKQWFSEGLQTNTNLLSSLGWRRLSLSLWNDYRRRSKVKRFVSGQHCSIITFTQDGTFFLLSRSLRFWTPLTGADPDGAGPDGAGPVGADPVGADPDGAVKSNTAVRRTASELLSHLQIDQIDFVVGWWRRYIIC